MFYRPEDETEQRHVDDRTMNSEFDVLQQLLDKWSLKVPSTDGPGSKQQLYSAYTAIGISRKAAGNCATCIGRTPGSALPATAASCLSRATGGTDSPPRTRCKPEALTLHIIAIRGTVLQEGQ